MECVTANKVNLETSALLLPISMTALTVANIKHIITVTVTQVENKYGHVYVYGRYGRVQLSVYISALRGPGFWSKPGPARSPRAGPGRAST